MNWPPLRESLRSLRNDDDDDGDGDGDGDGPLDNVG